MDGGQKVAIFNRLLSDEKEKGKTRYHLAQEYAIYPEGLWFNSI